MNVEATAAMITIAIKYWSSKLSYPDIRTDTGETDPMAIALMAVSRASSIVRYDPEQIATFETALSGLIIDQLGAYGVHLYSDYGPEGMLYSALLKARIDADAVGFPYKTDMWIDLKPTPRVTVGEGYGRSFLFLYGHAEALRYWHDLRVQWNSDWRPDNYTTSDTWKPTFEEWFGNEPQVHPSARQPDDADTEGA